MDDKENIHSGHRKRMKERFARDGGKGFADHELLELLLFYVMPRCDTNDLAHRLIEECGSLIGVMESDPTVLCEVTGIKENGALFLKAISELASRYTEKKLYDPEDTSRIFDTPEKIASYMMPRYMSLTSERVYMLLFDNAMKLLDCHHVCDGTVGKVEIPVRVIVEQTVKKNAAGVILTHNHPNGLAVPSKEDVYATKRLEEALRLVEIPLIEHFIFTERAYAPIMTAFRPEEAEGYAASSLKEVFRRRLAECSGRRG